MRTGPAQALAVVVFTDLVGSTALRSRLGEERAEQVRRQHDKVLSKATLANGGRVVKGLGDGVMAVFSSASDAVTAAAEMQQRIGQVPVPDGAGALEIRVGVSAGEVTWEGEDCFGTPVVEAARLEAAARGGQILAADIVRVLAGSRGAGMFVPMGELSLKGLAGPLTACEVVWEPLAPEATLPAVLAVRPPLSFVGRDPELRALASAWAAACSGERRFVALAGEPGIGKTRLLAEFARSAAVKDVAVLYGRAEEGLAVPYGPFVEAIRGHVRRIPADRLAGELGPWGGELSRLLPELPSIVPDLAAPLRAESGTERFRLFTAVDECLSLMASRRPILVVLDDLHWATAADTALLRHLLREPVAEPLLLMGAYRDTEVRAGHPLRSLLDDLPRLANTERLHLVGLAGDAVEDLFVEVTSRDRDEDGRRLAAEVHAETAGNPFFVAEILRQVQNVTGTSGGSVDLTEIGVPEGVRGIVARRLALLSDHAPEVLEVAAVVGARFDLPLLLAAIGGDGEVVLGVLDAAEDAALLAPDPAQPATYRFAHALVRATLYDGLSSARRLALHRRVGLALESLPDAEQRSLQLARHFVASAPLGDADRALRYTRLAGDLARDSLAFEQAAAHYGRAVRLAEQYCPSEFGLRASLLLDLGNTLMVLGEHEDARDRIAEAAGFAREAGDHDLVARTALGFRGPLRLMANDPREIDLLEEALADVGESDSPTRAHLTAHLSLALPDIDPRGTVLSADAEQLGRHVDDPAVRYAVAQAVFWSSFDPAHLGRLTRAAADALRAAEDAGSAELAVDALLIGVLAADQVGDRAQAERLLDKAEVLGAELGVPWFSAGPLMCRAKHLLDRGDLGAADRMLEDLVVRFPTEVTMMPYGAAVLLSRRWRGRHEEMDDLVQANAARTAKDLALVAIDTAVLAQQAASTGRHDEARQVLGQLTDGEIPCPLPGSWAVQAWLPFAADAAVTVAETVAGRRLRNLLRPWSGLQLQVSNGVLLGPANLYIGRLDALLGDVDDAVAHLDDGIAMSDATGSRAWAAFGRAALAEVLDHRDPSRARELRMGARVVAEELGLVLVLDLC